MPDPSFSSLYEVPDFPSTLILDLYTTSSSLPILVSCVHLAIGHIFHVVAVLGGEFSAHSCCSDCLPCLKVTNRSGENGRNFWCNVGATQPIGIFLHPPSCKTTAIGWICDILNSFHYGP